MTKGSHVGIQHSKLDPLRYVLLNVPIEEIGFNDPDIIQEALVQDALVND